MAADIIYRAPWPDEFSKLARSFSPPFSPEVAGASLLACTPPPRERLLGLFTMAKLPGVEGEADKMKAQFYWRVVPNCEGSEMERQLLQRGIADARANGFRMLSTQATMESGSRAHALLQDLGFNVGEEIDEFEAPFSAVWERCQRVYKMLERRVAIPPTAQIMSFEPQLLPELRAIFHNTRIVGCLDFDARLGKNHSEPTDLLRSTAILLDDKLIGAMMVCPSIAASTYTVSGRWVAEGHRNSWVNAVLIYNSVRQGVPMNLDRVRFVAHRDIHKETAVLAGKLGGHKIRGLQRLTLSLND